MLCVSLASDLGRDKVFLGGDMAGIETKPSKKSKTTDSLANVDLSALEPIIDQLLSGAVDEETAKDVAIRLQEFGCPPVLDHTEQLRLALRLLECHDDSVSGPKKRQKPAREPEAGLV